CCSSAPRSTCSGTPCVSWTHPYGLRAPTRSARGRCTRTHPWCRRGPTGTWEGSRPDGKLARLVRKGNVGATSSELLRAEDAGWNELHALIDSLTPAEAERP